MLGFEARGLPVLLFSWWFSMFLTVQNTTLHTRANMMVDIPGVFTTPKYILCTAEHSQNGSCRGGREIAPANRNRRQDYRATLKRRQGPPNQLPRALSLQTARKLARSLPLRGDNHVRCTYSGSPQSRCGCVHKQLYRDMCTIIGY